MACFTVRGYDDVPPLPAGAGEALPAAVAEVSPDPHAARPRESTAAATPTDRARNALIRDPFSQVR
ncbi:hypothetical protein Psi01_30320 [Planobispora siamensis]|uniref:Uncharacterized protein n=1 Tax=Planobispora siamensis TaxID=936338 RepID=A0A8J3WLB4_9ACTN|nr:hypothetical protein Psi01_30320 [Planobispora siamensis]